MQFLANGPEVPDRLLLNLEQGNVVFFCGAGISVNAGLPIFESLITEICGVLKENPEGSLQTAIAQNRYDLAFGLIEKKRAESKSEIRQNVAKILEPSLSEVESFNTHKALLKLSRGKDEKIRLVTTNFDRIFEKVLESETSKLKSYTAPLLPTPKKDFHGLVYLHGLIKPDEDKESLQDLVLSSGDFGLAYLTESYASRFVAHLFRNFTVCFVGYSLDDPILRYMVDAIAADKKRGETANEIFAFDAFLNGEEQKKINEWEDKEITPILYKKTDNHEFLHKTLWAWADNHVDDINARKKIINTLSSGYPQGSTKEDDFVGRVLWALSDLDGYGARVFSKQERLPPFEWLQEFESKRYHHKDLTRFGISPIIKKENYCFSLIDRPPVFRDTKHMSLSEGFDQVGGGDWDPIIDNLANWLVRHMNNRQFFLWLIKKPSIHIRLKRLIRAKLKNNWASHEEELPLLKDSVPNSQMAILWKLLIDDRIKTSNSVIFAPVWMNSFNQEGLTYKLRKDILKYLSPLLTVKGIENEPFYTNRKEEQKPTNLNCFFSFEVDLYEKGFHQYLDILQRNNNWKKSLPCLLSEFRNLLKEALDLKRDVGQASCERDYSYISIPSISLISGIINSEDWSVLVQLTRDSWLATLNRSPCQAFIEAKIWHEIPYPSFKRLSFFAATNHNIIPLELAFDWLTSENYKWFWSLETRREAIRLLVSIFPKLDKGSRHILEEKIIGGPLYLDNENGSIHKLKESDIKKEIWIRLAKIESENPILSDRGKAKLKELSKQQPSWEILEDQTDELVKSFRAIPMVTIQKEIPEDLKAMVAWIKHDHLNDTPIDLSTDIQVNWKQLCSKDITTTSSALIILSKENLWPVNFWWDALQVWSEEDKLGKVWGKINQVAIIFPEEEFRELLRPFAYWLEVNAEYIDEEDNYIALATKIINLDLEENLLTLSSAINRPIGLVTNGIIKSLLRTQVFDGQGLSKLKQHFFGRLIEKNLYSGLFILFKHIVFLFRLDPSWVIDNLIPFLSWKRNQKDAQLAWQAFFWAPRVNPALMLLIKECFLETASHYLELGNESFQYAAVLTHLSLDSQEYYSSLELKNAVKSLPEEGKVEMIITLREMIRQEEGEDISKFWEQRVEPFFDNIWPDDRSLISARIAENFSLLCISSGTHFPVAFRRLQDWIVQLNDSDTVVSRLCDSGLCESFPIQTLDLLDLLINRDSHTPPSELHDCLNKITPIENNSQAKYNQLLTFSKRYIGE